MLTVVVQADCTVECWKSRLFLEELTAVFVCHSKTYETVVHATVGCDAWPVTYGYLSSRRT